MADQKIFEYYVAKIESFQRVAYSREAADELETWLHSLFPNIRVRYIGDENMVWFSQSRGNPPAPEMETFIDYVIDDLNLAAMRSMMRLIDLKRYMARHPDGPCLL